MAAPCSAHCVRGTVVEVARAGSDGVRLDLRVAEPLGAIRASQFFMLRRADGAGPFLGRPFSLYLRKRDPRGEILSFLMKVIGAGTRALADLAPGEGVELTGPLGNGFPKVARGERLVCVAGGVGIATFPLVFEQAIEGGARPEDLVLCFGAATKAFLYEAERYQQYGIGLRLATDDGTEGLRGNALDLLRSERGASAPAKVFTCGPERMLEAVARYCDSERIDCWLSLETRMGCGTGVCNVCAVPVKRASNGGWPVAKACREGPVFRSSDLVLEEAHEL
jgi:dihydroorotate dehydrogenase electron transfer subunit